MDVITTQLILSMIIRMMRGRLALHISLARIILLPALQRRHHIHRRRHMIIPGAVDLLTLFLVPWIHQQDIIAPAAPHLTNGQHHKPEPTYHTPSHIQTTPMRWHRQRLLHLIAMGQDLRIDKPHTRTPPIPNHSPSPMDPTRHNNPPTRTNKLNKVGTASRLPVLLARLNTVTIVTAVATVQPPAQASLRTTVTDLALTATQDTTTVPGLMNKLCTICCEPAIPHITSLSWLLAE
ncbi:hypothetical protein F5B19DRAFT_214210 [Rostrohypoxylon terebratum]|nr:hypothetical protein F5B19DRAFT_214210 [Rostrohypoxylon terebratum]